MKTLSVFALTLALATGAAFAQGSGSGSGGGTEAGESGKSTGKSNAAMTPTVDQCKKGWDSTMRMTEAEFKAGCAKK